MNRSRGRGRHIKVERSERLLSPRDQLHQLHYLPKALGLVWEAAPRWTAATVALLIVQGLLPVFTVFLTRDLVDHVAAVVQNRGDRVALEAAVISALLMGLVLLAGEALSSLSGYVRMALAEQVQDQMNARVHQQAISLDLQFYESPGYYDQLHRATVEALDRPLALLDNIGSLLQSTITLLAMSGVLIAFAWWMPLVLLLGTLPALWVALRTTWAIHRWRLRRTFDQRRLGYFNRILSTDLAAAELRLFGLGEHYRQAYRSLRRVLKSERLQLARHQATGQFLAGGVGLIGLAISLGWVLGQALLGQYSLGELAMAYQVMNQGQRLMRNVLGGLGDIYRNMLFLDDLFIFLALRPQVTDPAAPVAVAPGLHDAVRLEGVTFHYPDSPRLALEGFNLTIPAGQVVAIVGENGAGKSTLIKLLNRFYDPDAGRITWDGVDLRAMTLTDLRRRITVLFQQPVAYHESVADNIAFGDFSGQQDHSRLETAAAQAGADAVIARLPDGYETLLGKWFGQTDLSVGEWQRIALARAFVRNADLIILDEPTSAMDSWAEHAWMTRFRALVTGRAALIITHRFTTAMQADMIHVMVAGKVVESGSHAELLAREGRYAQSWRAQFESDRAAQALPVT